MYYISVEFKKNSKLLFFLLLVNPVWACLYHMIYPYTHKQLCCAFFASLIHTIMVSLDVVTLETVNLPCFRIQLENQDLWKQLVQFHGLLQLLL